TMGVASVATLAASAPALSGVAMTATWRWTRSASIPGSRSAPPAALALDRKKLAAFSALGGGFLRFPVGDRRCNRTRASVGNAGGNARPSLTNATLAASRLLHRRSPTAPCLERCIGRPPKKVGRIFGPRRGLRLPAWPRLVWTAVLRGVR